MMFLKGNYLCIMAQAGETLYESICNKLMLNQHLFGLHVKEGTPLKDPLDKLNSVMLELHDIDVKLEDEDFAMILLASPPPPLPLI